MKRYFMVHDDHMPKIEEDVGHWHYIALDSHGPNGAAWNLVCLNDPHVSAPVDWLAFPPLIDAKTTLAASPVLDALLGDVGLTGQETCLEAVIKLGEINPIMGL